MPGEHTLGEIAAHLGGEVRGDARTEIRGVATLESAGPDQIAFLTNRRYRRLAESTRAGAVLVAPGTSLPGKVLLEVEEPYAALAELLELFHPPAAHTPGVSPDARLGRGVDLGADVAVGPFAVVEDEVRLGDRSIVGAGSFVGRGAVVGEDTELKPRVVIYPGTRVGSRCILHAGVVLGGDGFGFATTGGRHRKLPQLGTVVVEDDVEIGANTTVDRGTLEETVVGEGSKIDNLVMIAHGVRVGPHCLMAGQAGIAGSTVVGRQVTFAGQSGASGHISIGDGCVVAAKSAVFADLPDGSFVAGVPARDHREWKRTVAAERRLPRLRSELRQLRTRVDAIEKALAEED